MKTKMKVYNSEDRLQDHTTNTSHLRKTSGHMQEVGLLITQDAQVKQGGNKDPRARETDSDPIDPDQEAQEAHTPGDTRHTDQGPRVITDQRQGTATLDPDHHPAAGIRTKSEPRLKHKLLH